MVQQRPELFAAYVGTGQASSWADTVQFQFDFLKRRYKESGDTGALAALDAIGKPDPANVKQYFGFSRPIRQPTNASDTAWLAGLTALIEASVRTDLFATATHFTIPDYIIQGREDLFAPTPFAEAYFNKVAAPKKRLFIIEDAGHFALATHQREVIAALNAVIPR